MRTPTNQVGLVVLILMLCMMANCAKILVMVTVGSPSLFNLFTPIIQELAKRNHDITTQSYFALQKPLPNVKEMIMKPSAFFDDKNASKSIILGLAEMNPIREIYAYAEYAEEDCSNYLNDDTTKALISAGKQYDLVLAEAASMCAVVASTVYGKLIVGFYSNGNYPWQYSDVPLPPSYVPHYYRPRSSVMDFWQRMINAVEVTSFRLIGYFGMESVDQKVLSRHLPQAPTLVDAIGRIELVLANADPVMYSPRPSMPNIINCGGLHIKATKPLPKELNDFVESSGDDDGFIIFGLGTNMRSEYLSHETLDFFLTAFSRLKQKVIWKLEAQLENVPSNVLITKWMPQQDLLAHPKIRLFISHSGLLSMQEAVFYGVPVIGIPFYMDQPGNIGRIQELGIGEYLNFFNITTDGFYNLIRKVLMDKRYSENAKKYSAIFKDQPDKPLDRAIYWIEYVLRHGGAQHFRPAARDLNIFQYFLLDVIGLLLLVAIGAIALVVFVTKMVLKKLLARKEVRSSDDKKRK